MPPVADHVDKNVLVEFLPEFDSQFGGEHYRFCIIPVHVDHGGINDLSDIRTIYGRSTVIKVSSKSYLVVDHKVDRSSCIEAFEVGHLGYLIHDTLTRYRRVSVDQNGNRFIFIPIVLGINFRAYKPLYYRIYRLQVGRVRGEL